MSTTDRISDETEVRAATAEQAREFPFDRNEEAQVTRREFCNFLALTSTALLAGTAGVAAKSAFDSRTAPTFAAMKIDGAEKLLPGTAMNFRYPTAKDTAILVRSIEGHYHAYGQKCTHLSCPVYYDHSRARLECPCHEASFEVETGGVIAGPPPRPLDRIELEVREGGIVWAVARKVGSHGRVD